MFKINSNKKVIDENKDLIRPDVGVEGVIIKTINFTENEFQKLERLRAKYKISRSAIIRILINSIPELEQENNSKDFSNE